MEALPATDCEGWRSAISAQAEARLHSAIDELADFPVLDGSVQRVLAVLDDPDTNTADLVDVLEADPTFAANLLRFANSAARAQPIRANTIRQAVMLVGRKLLRRLALEAATFRFLERAPGAGGTSQGELHVHALAVSSLSAAIAESIRQPADTAHLGALLHDIGRLVLPAAFGPAECDALVLEHPDAADRVLAERARFGIDHASAGALLAERWNLPAEVVAAIAWHHGGPTGVAAPTPVIACVQLANESVSVLSGREADHALIEVALERAGLEAAALDGLRKHAGSIAVEREGEDALSVRVAEVDHLSETDPLTGVANRRHWLQATRADLGEGGAPGALLLCEVAGLPAIAAQHGPRVADVVFNEAARTLAAHGRAGRVGPRDVAVWVRGDVEAARRAAAAATSTLAAWFAAPPDGVATGLNAGLTFGFGTAAPGSGDLDGLLRSAQRELHAMPRAVEHAAARDALLAAPLKPHLAAVPDAPAAPRPSILRAA